MPSLHYQGVSVRFSQQDLMKTGSSSCKYGNNTQFSMTNSRKILGQRVKFVPFSSVQFSCSVMSDSLQPHGLKHQASLSITNSRSLLKLMSIESVMPSNHLILCRPLLLLPSIFPSIGVFSNESALHIRWPEY